MKRRLNFSVCVFFALCILFFSDEVSANSGDVMWQANGVAICTAGNNQEYSHIISDGCGGAIVSWRDYRNGSDWDVYAQRVDAEGNPLWSTNGVAICNVGGNQVNPQLISDGCGGAIITWDDERDGTGDIYAQKVNADGGVQWKADGVEICTAGDVQWIPRLISDNSGGAIITWRDKRSGNYDIYAQRVDANGNVQWTTNGVAICIAVGEQRDSHLILDGNGGAIIVWRDKRSGTEYDIYAQRVNASGNVQWQTNGVVICTAGGDQEYPRLTSDGNGGAIVTWRDGRDGNWDIYGQRVDGDGNPIWQPNEAGICTESSNQWGPKVISDGSGGAVIAWWDYRNGATSDIYCQRVDANGNPYCQINGVAICTAQNKQWHHNLISSGSDVIITWEDERDGNADIYAQMMDTEGNFIWQTNGIAICTAGGDQVWPRLTSDGKGGSIITWYDKRSGTEYDIYAQRVEGRSVWYLAEGCTKGFDEWVLLQNPNTQDADVRATFMKPDGSTVTEDITVPATGRYTICVNDYVHNDSVSTKVESTNGVGIIAERAMYWDADGMHWAGGHCSCGVRQPALTWYLAEGCTAGFDEWVLIQNPNDESDANVRVTFMKPDGSTVTEDITVPETGRYTIYVNDYVPDNSVSTKVESTNGVGIIAERAMYWDVDGVHWAGGHCSCGVTSTATTWYLAEGCTDGFDEWVLIQNPNSQSANVTVTFMKSDGSTVQEPIGVPATGRYTIHVNDYVPNESVSTKVESDIGVIAERAMYWDVDGMHWAGGHCSCGVTGTATTWYLAEGCTADFDEWVLIQNPNPQDANVTVTFMKPDGSTVPKNITVPATGRYTVHVNDYVADESVSTKVESNIGVIAERAMYWDVDGHRWMGGHCSRGIPE